MLEQRRHIVKHIFGLPFFAEVIEPADSLPVEQRRQARVLHQTAPPSDDSNANPCHTALSCSSVPVKKAQL